MQQTLTTLKEALSSGRANLVCVLTDCRRPTTIKDLEDARQCRSAREAEVLTRNYTRPQGMDWEIYCSLQTEFGRMYISVDADTLLTLCSWESTESN